MPIHSRSRPYLALLALSFALISMGASDCKLKKKISGEESPQQASQPAPAPAPALVTGPMLDAFSRKYAGLDPADRCDLESYSAQRDVSVELDRRKEEIQAMRVRLAQAETALYREVGPATLTINPIERKEPTSRKRHSWARILMDHATIKDKPVNADWVRLDNDAKRVVELDRERLAGVPMSTDAQEESTLETIRNKLVVCASQPECTDPKLDQHEHALMNKRFKQQMEPPASMVKRLTVLLMREWVVSDLKRLEFRRNGSVGRSSATEITLPLDPGPFAGYEDKLGALIESHWDVSGLQLRIVWRKSTPENPIYAIELSQEWGRKSQSFESARVLRIVQGDSIDSIRDEVKKILGIVPPRGYLWASEPCDYVFQARTRKSVSEYDLLDRAYPFVR